MNAAQDALLFAALFKVIVIAALALLATVTVALALGGDHM